MGLLLCAGVTALTRVEHRRSPEAAIHQVTHEIEGQQVHVEVALERSGAPVDARVWWLLAEPGDQQPWISPAYRSETRDIRLEAGVTELIWDEELPMPGTYQMSVWVHTGGATVAGTPVYAHAAGRFESTLVQVQPGRLGRTMPPAEDVRIGDAQAISDEDPGSYQVQILNEGDDPRLLLLDWGRLDQTREQQVVSATVEVVAAPGASTLDVETGANAPGIWLRLRDADTLVFLDEAALESSD